mgnify:CR=1 FL=1|tara:strand:- start:3 stop:671 length:669 start_codon:yes stop_codon:yes gene_type:complete
MAKKYFRNIPDFDYIDRTKDGQSISDYTRVKNIFKRAQISEDIFQDLNFFTKYQVKGNERPDNVAKKVYNDPNLDWLVMLCNNILNFETEWPKDQVSYDKYLLNKYGTYEKLNEVHHYETNLITDKAGRQIVPEGLEVPQDFSITFFDPTLKQMVTRSSTFPVSNLIYENRLEEDKRSIFILKGTYLALVIDDINEIMPYTPGSTQYVSDRVVRGENIRLYI